MEVLVIVVTYNGMRTLERCLQSVRASEFPAKLFVVDNDSTDGSADFVQSRFPEAKLLRSADNLGFAKANNLGLRYAWERGFDYAYLLNQDAWIEPDTLGRLVAVQQAHPEFAVLSPMQYKDGFSDFDNLFKNNVLRGVSYSGAEVCRVPRVMAAHWLVSRRALEAAGLFAPVFPLYGEDDNYCDRLRYHGLKAGIVPGARAVHDRAGRKEPLEKVIHRNYYMGSLCRLCDINRPFWERMLFVCLFTLVKAFKYRSTLPFKHFRTLVAMRGEVRTVRRVTREKGAYLSD